LAGRRGGPKPFPPTRNEIKDGVRTVHPGKTVKAKPQQVEVRLG